MARQEPVVGWLVQVLRDPEAEQILRVEIRVVERVDIGAETGPQDPGQVLSLKRSLLFQPLRWAGLTLDAERNQRNELRLSVEGSRLAAYAIPTDEEYLIARETLRLMANASTVGR